MNEPTVAGALRLSNGVAPAEFDRVAAALGHLDERFRSYAAGTAELQPPPAQ
jgi:hypothetical protein